MSDKPSDKPSVSDDEWAAFVESAREQGIGTQADVRALRKAKPPKPPKRPKRQEPAGWRTGPAWQELNGRAQRKRRLKAILGVALAAGLALIAVRPQLATALLPDSVTSALPSSWTDHPEDTTPLAAETAAPTAPPAQADPHRPTLEEPFRGSPAVRWADGAAGIELPEAKATGGLSKQRVADGLRRTRELLIAANLDPATLAGGRPAKALALIDPEQRDLHHDMEASLRKPTRQLDPLYWFTRFGPEVEPVGAVVKTRGRISYAAGDLPGSVRITADYSFVYPLVKKRAGADEVSRTIVRRTLVLGLYDGRSGPATPGTLVLIRHVHDAANSSCSLLDGFLHPQFAEDVPAVRPSGDPVDPYDRSGEQSTRRTGEGCRPVSRT